LNYKQDLLLSILYFRQFQILVHGTLNADRYYGLFEIIRNGAEAYFKATNKNYFSDLVNIHRALGLTIDHKNATLLFPLVSVNSMPLQLENLSRTIFTGSNLKCPNYPSN
jgi:hypothetical protein